MLAQKMPPAKLALPRGVGIVLRPFRHSYLC